MREITKRCEAFRRERLQLGLELWRFAHSHWPGFADAAEQHFGANYERVENDGQLFTSWAFFHERSQQGQTLMEAYLQQPGLVCSPLRHELIAAERAAWISMWEVLKVDRKRGVFVRDLITDDEVWVSDKQGSRSLEPGVILCGRVTRMRDLALFGGIYPRVLPRNDDWAAKLVSEAKVHFSRGGGPVCRAILLEDSEPLGILNCWRMLHGLRRPFHRTHRPTRALRSVAAHGLH